MRLAIVVTHPIRYFVPLIQLLKNRGRLQLKVFYTYGPELLKTRKYDPLNWKKSEPDLPIFEGYEYTFVYNQAKNKSTFKYDGIDNPTLISEIQQWSPQAILICGWKFKSHLRVMRHFKGKVPVHFRGDSTLLEGTGRYLIWKMIRRLFLKWIYSHIDIAWYVGVQNKVYYQHAGLLEKQLVFVPHSVDNNRFARTPERINQAKLLRTKLNIPLDAVVLLYAGKLIPAKGVLLLLDAFVKSNCNTTHLLFVGSGSLENQIKAAVKARENIHFLPYQPQTQMPLIYSIADVLILPSQSDTWGLVINEAMANGLAIVSTNMCGATYDLVENEKNGFIFNTNDSDRLTAIIQQLSADRKRVLEMGDYSRERIRSFSYEVAANAIEALLLKRYSAE